MSKRYFVARRYCDQHERLTEHLVEDVRAVANLGLSTERRADYDQVLACLECEPTARQEARSGR